MAGYYSWSSCPFDYFAVCVLHRGPARLDELSVCWIVHLQNMLIKAQNTFGFSKRQISAAVQRGQNVPTVFKWSVVICVDNLKKKEISFERLLIVHYGLISNGSNLKMKKLLKVPADHCMYSCWFDNQLMKPSQVLLFEFWQPDGVLSYSFYQLYFYWTLPKWLFMFIL